MRQRIGAVPITKENVIARIVPVLYTYVPWHES
jgi:hypothetical protein